MTATWGGHQWRVEIQWLTTDDLWPTWYAVTVHPGWATWADVRDDEATWADVMRDAGVSGVEYIEDITCDVAGFTTRRGRNSGVAEVFAGELELTLVDPTGVKYDPRWSPGGPSRAGARITVEVIPFGTTEWRHMFTGFVETWMKTRKAEGDEPVNVVASDALHLMARARAEEPEPLDAPIGGGELAGARIVRLLDAMPWTSRWGDLDIEAGTVTMNPTALDDKLLDEAHEVTLSEDGIFDVTPDGIIRWRGEAWRDRRDHYPKALIDLTGYEPAGRLPVLCPSQVPLANDDINMATRVSVSRSVEFDPDPAPDVHPVEHVETRSSAWAVNRFGPIEPFDLRSLPHTTNTRSAALAQLWIDRLATEPAVLSTVTIPLTKEPRNVAPIVGFDWGDPVWIVDNLFTARTLYALEIIGIEHDVNVDGTWTCRILLDHWWGAEPIPLPTGSFSSAFARGFDTAAV